MIKTQFIFCLFICFSVSLCAQSDIPLGTWKSYLPHNKALHVTQSSDKIFLSTGISVFTLTKDDNSIDYLSKVEGLNDNSIAEIAYNQDLNQLIIAYNNNNIDLVTEDQVINIANIKNNTNIQGDRTIYDIYINENRAYFSTGFGVVEYDLESLEFGFTTKTDGIAVFECTVLDNTLFAATEDGIYSVSLSQNIVQGDFAKWSLLSSDSGLPLVYTPVSLVSKFDRVYMATENVLYSSDNGFDFDTLAIETEEKFSTKFISEQAQELVWCTSRRGFSLASFSYFNSSNDRVLRKSYTQTRPTFLLAEDGGKIWLGDEFNEIRFLEDKESGISTFEINGPNSEKVYDLHYQDEVIYAAAGGPDDFFANTFTRKGFYILEDGLWTNINEINTAAIKDSNLVSLNQIVKHPSKNLLYVGSFFEGLLEYNLDTKEARVFNEHNSTLRGQIGNDKRIFVTELIFDEQENLWISNWGAPQPLSVLRNNGEWKSYFLGATKNPTEIDIDLNGNFWIVNQGNNGGVTVFNPGENLSQPTVRFINSTMSELTTNLVRSVRVDKQGDVWVGTDKGPVPFECGGTPFESECQGSLRKVLQDSIPAILLATEDIRAIEIDGADRKWFGTKNGVFVQSSDGETQIHHFTAENSPLFNNNIRDMVFSPISGEMFIGTESGIISYRTETTKGSVVHSNNVYAFPNPVRPDYNGPIAIKGLANNAAVKITDINGRLVHETEALGGQAIWDGQDYTGRKASTGVYLVFSSSDSDFEDPDSFVTKILFIN